MSQRFSQIAKLQALPRDDDRNSQAEANPTLSNLFRFLSLYVASLIFLNCSFIKIFIASLYFTVNTLIRLLIHSSIFPSQVTRIVFSPLFFLQ